MVWSWKDSPDLIKRLEAAQNNKFYRQVDIMTMAGIVESEAELLRHVESCEAAIDDLKGAKLPR